MTIPAEDFCRLVGTQLGIAQVNLGDKFFADLGAESLDVVILIGNLETRYSIKIPEDQLWKIQTVGELHAIVNQLVAAGEET